MCSAVRCTLLLVESWERTNRRSARPVSKFVAKGSSERISKAVVHAYVRFSLAQRAWSLLGSLRLRLASMLQVASAISSKNTTKGIKMIRSQNGRKKAWEEPHHPPPPPPPELRPPPYVDDDEYPPPPERRDDDEYDDRGGGGGGGARA